MQAVARRIEFVQGAQVAPANRDGMEWSEHPLHKAMMEMESNIRHDLERHFAEWRRFFIILETTKTAILATLILVT